MRKALELENKTFNGIYVKKRIFKEDTKNSYWKCICFCGKEFICAGTQLTKQNLKSCGCLCTNIGYKNPNFRHGGCGTKEYSIWCAMKKRCYNKKSQDYYLYGAQGITVEKRWHKFANFLEDMGKCPLEKYSIDRIDSTKGYFKENCRWADAKEQATNTKRVKKYLGKTMKEWCEEYNLNYHLVRSRILKGWPLFNALFLEKGQKKLNGG